MIALERAAAAAVLVVAVGMLGALGCNESSLPLPPPGPPESVVEAEGGLWQITGACFEGAFVTVVNTEGGDGAVVEDRDLDGFYTVTIEGNRCDKAWATQQLGQERSAHTVFLLDHVDGSCPD